MLFKNAFIIYIVVFLCLEIEYKYRLPIDTIIQLRTFLC